MFLGRYVLAVCLLAGTAGYAGTAAAQPCDDFDDCTDNDMCSNGECHGTPGSSPCDDGNPCTTGDTCTPEGCMGMPAEGGDCDDNNPCTAGDACLPGAGVCIGLTPGTEGAECNGGCGTCQPIAPFPGVPLFCTAKPNAQGMPCTGSGEDLPCFDNKCLAFGTVVQCLPSLRACPDNDGNPCLTSFCNPETNQCVPNQPKCVQFCETCNQANGLCQPAHLNEACDDSDVCTAQSTCQPFEISPDRTFCQAGGVVGPTATPPLVTPTATPPVVVPTATATSIVPTATSIPPTAIPTSTAPPSTPTSTRTRVVGTPTATLPAGRCVGDCNHDGNVRTDEVITGVEIALGRADLNRCSPFDANENNNVSVDELVFGVNAALHGCTSAAAAAQ